MLKLPDHLEISYSFLFRLGSASTVTCHEDPTYGLICKRSYDEVDEDLEARLGSDPTKTDGLKADPHKGK